MKNYKSKFEDFKTEELSKIKQKTVNGGDTDPAIGTGKGMGLVALAIKVNILN